MGNGGRRAVAVIGGGVAGLAAVRALQHAGHAPLHIAPTRAQFANRGELLGPGALVPLTTLGWRGLLDDARVALPADARFSAWGSPALARLPVPPNGAGWHIDRQQLEAAMRTQIDDGPLDRIDATVRGCEAHPDGWCLALPNDEVVHVRFIIDATGRAATIARKLGGRRRHDDRLVAMYQAFQVSGMEVMAASLVEATPDGWWYSSRLAGADGIFAAFVSDADLLPVDGDHDQTWTQHMGEAPYTRARLASLAIAEAAPNSIVRAGTAVQERVAGDGWAAIGDAAIALDPLAGHGLTVALWSAHQAAQAAVAWLEGNSAPLQQYQEAVGMGATRFAADAARHYRAERRFRDRPFWRRRLRPAAPAPPQPRRA